MAGSPEQEHPSAVSPPGRSAALDRERTRDLFAASTDFTIGLEEEFAIVDPDSLELVNRFEDLYAAAQRDDDHGGRTMAELSDAEKDAISHRGRAAREPEAWLGR